MKVYVVYAGCGWERPIVHAVCATNKLAQESRKEANELYGRVKGTIGAFRVESMELRQSDAMLAARGSE